MAASRFSRILAGTVKAAAGSFVYTLIAFAGAGCISWIRGWAYAAVFVAVSAFGTLIVHATNPDLMAARAKGLRKDAKPFDKIFFLMFVPLTLAYPALAGLDAYRFALAPLPGWTFVAGAILFIAGSAFGTWAMTVNRHAETTVRLQDDRGQTVIASGPYEIVRHPMYLGTITGLPGTALMLGSGLALIPAALIVVLFVWRTAREDEALRNELIDYEAYAQKTRFRLVPGVW